jgi:hypothetical protein
MNLKIIHMDYLYLGPKSIPGTIMRRHGVLDEIPAKFTACPLPMTVPLPWHRMPERRPLSFSKADWKV